MTAGKKITDLNKILGVIDEFVSEEWQQTLEVNKVKLEFPKGTKIFSEGESADFVQIIESGKVKVFADYNGQERIIRLATNGQVLGHRGFGGDNKYSVSAVALAPTKLVNIQRKVFDDVLKANPLFCYYFMIFFAEELKRSEWQMKNLSCMPVKNRVAQALKMNFEVFGLESRSGKLAFPMSRKDISNIAVTTYESVIRVLSDFDKEGLIKIEGKSIYIEDKKALLSMSQM